MTWQLKLTKTFVRDYRALPETTAEEVDKALGLLITNPRHPSLQVKKMQPKSRGIYEARVTQGYRMTFTLVEDTLIMRRVGTHDILRTP